MKVSTVFSEFLRLKQFEDGKVLADFDFKTTSSQQSYSQLLEIFDHYQVNQVDLHFTRGRWFYERYGYTEAHPQGAQLLAKLPKQHWEGLTNALSGLFCASLVYMDESVTSDFESTFDPAFRYAALSRETVCTENLTPWAKQLPCQLKAGLASLLNAYKIFDGNYQSLGLHYSKPCPDCEWELVQKMTILFDPLRTHGHKSWSVDSLFGSVVEKHCPLAHETKISLDLGPGAFVSYVPSQQPEFTLQPSDFPFRMQVDWESNTVDRTNKEKMPIFVHRYLSGVGDAEGKIYVDFVNHLQKPVNVLYTESIPWILKLYLHTLEFKNLDKHWMQYQGAIDRVRPSVLELNLTLHPGKSSLVFDIERTFIKVNEHHPDANHGFDIGSGILLYDGKPMYTESLLIRLPTPDFSMPYNVITLSCTVMALFFGSAFNLLVKFPQTVPVK
ncbi:GPI transamidase component PIG-T, partial [Gorgonomyces haynaldii]